uniref:Uncharacterized protein n=1 Tax=Cacopsylla melanoneura TaxID=428564 RepID=A0A8D8W443_9HEMI
MIHEACMLKIFIRDVSILCRKIIHRYLRYVHHIQYIIYNIQQDNNELLIFFRGRRRRRRSRRERNRSRRRRVRNGGRRSRSIQKFKFYNPTENFRDILLLFPKRYNFHQTRDNTSQ